MSPEAEPRKVICSADTATSLYWYVHAPTCSNGTREVDGNDKDNIKMPFYLKECALDRQDTAIIRHNKCY